MKKKSDSLERQEGADSFLGDAGGVLRVFASVNGAEESEEKQGKKCRICCPRWSEI